MDATAIILAAGEGTRMKSNHCKVSHKILGKPMVQWIVDATIKAGCSRVVVVIGSHADEMRALIDGTYANSATKVECVEQTERLGTGHAVKVALEACGITQGPVVVLNGDLPLITADTVAKFAQTVATGELACTVMTMTPPGSLRLRPHQAGRRWSDRAHHRAEGLHARAGRHAARVQRRLLRLRRRAARRAH